MVLLWKPPVSGGVGGWVLTRFRAAGMNAFPASCKSSAITYFRALSQVSIVLPIGDCGRALKELFRWSPMSC